MEVECIKLLRCGLHLRKEPTVDSKTPPFVPKAFSRRVQKAITPNKTKPTTIHQLFGATDWAAFHHSLAALAEVCAGEPPTPERRSMLGGLLRFLGDLKEVAEVSGYPLWY